MADDDVEVDEVRVDRYRADRLGADQVSVDEITGETPVVVISPSGQVGPPPGVASTPSTRPPRRRRRLLRAVLVMLVLTIAAIGGGVLWVKAKLDPSGPPGAVVAVEVAEGSSTSAIAQQLADAGVVADARVFRLYLWFRAAERFQAGSYELRLRSSAWEALADLDSGPSLPPTVNLTVPEGLVLAEIANRVGRVDHLDSARFLAVATDGSVRSAFEPPFSVNLEGLLFPDTYRIGDDEDERAVLERMVATFELVAADVNLADAPRLVGVTPYEAVIVASLIEAEAKVDADRPKIARVIYNRLQARMPLGIDAAFYYVLGPERRGTSLRRSDLERDGPYNTRLRVGLVPTPIMAPGRASLAAALAPADGPWLYYVLQDKTTHAFSESYSEFLRNKAAAERAGLIP